MKFRAGYISYADYGGPLVHTKEFIKEFQKLIPDLMTYCPHLEKDSSCIGPGRETLLNKLFLHLPAWSRQLKLEFYQLRKLLRDWAKWPYFAKLYQEQNVDIVVVRYDVYVMAPIYAAYRRGIPVLLEVNGILSKHHSDRITRLFENFVLSKMDGAFAVCNPLAQLLVNLKVPIEKIRVIPNGVCLENFQSPNLSVVPASLRRKLNDKTVIGYVGTFTVYHDLLTLISGFARALSKVPNLCLLLIGEGRNRHQVIEIVKSFGVEKNTFFADKVSNNHIPSYLQLCTIVVNPMKQIYKDGFHGAPIKMFEYMAARKPIISTDFESLRHLLGDSAVFVAPGSELGWRDALITLAQDKKVQQEKGTQAFEHLIKCGYTWKENAKKVFEYCRDILVCSAGL